MNEYGDVLDDLTPIDFGLPPVFTSWRDIQKDAIQLGIYTDKRFLALAMPTGSGKSLTVMSIARITGYRTVILTGTKGLQDQYSAEFGQDTRTSKILHRMGVYHKPTESELVDVRGKGNYRCEDHRHTDCDEGAKIGCRVCGTERCPYTNALTIARNSQTVVTNYKYWFNINRGSAGLTRALKPNPVELLVLDEAHLAPEELASFLAIRIYEQEIRDLLHIPPIHGDNLKEWIAFAKEWYKTVEIEAKERAKVLAQKGVKAGRVEIQTQKKYEALADKLGKLKAVKEDGWVCEEIRGRRGGVWWEFDCVWPGMYAEGNLFLGIPRVILISATLRPKTLGLLGAKWEQSQFKEWPRIFPANRCPIYSIPAQRPDGTHVRIKWGSPDSDLKLWVEQIDAIIGPRLGRKGVIHTVSYDRQKYLMEHSKYAQHMIGNTSDPDSPKAAVVVHDFKLAQAPCVLVSPSFSTGWDFPMQECEWQIIIKVPFPNTQSKVMKERIKRDHQYSNYIAMQDLIQSCGRGMRREEDRCETFIVDASISWFLAQNRVLAPNWFDPRKMAKVPTPPKSLAEEAVA